MCVYVSTHILSTMWSVVLSDVQSMSLGRTSGAQACMYIRCPGLHVYLVPRPACTSGTQACMYIWCPGLHVQLVPSPACTSVCHKCLDVHVLMEAVYYMYLPPPPPQPSPSSTSSLTLTSPNRNFLPNSPFLPLLPSPHLPPSPPLLPGQVEILHGSEVVRHMSDGRTHVHIMCISCAYHVHIVCISCAYRVHVSTHTYTKHMHTHTYAHTNRSKHTCIAGHPSMGGLCKRSKPA